MAVVQHIYLVYLVTNVNILILKKMNCSYCKAKIEVFLSPHVNSLKKETPKITIIYCFLKDISNFVYCYKEHIKFNRNYVWVIIKIGKIYITNTALKAYIKFVCSTFKESSEVQSIEHWTCKCSQPGRFWIP